MPGRLLQKCFVFICFSFICPKNRFQILASSLKVVKPNTSGKYVPNNVYSPTKWSLRVVRDQSNFPNGLDDAEPGFDLNDEEIKKFKIWPRGIIPYYVDDFSFDKVLRDKIRNYLDLTNRVTGLRFMELPKPPADENTRWVLFMNRQGLLYCADHSIHDYTNVGVQKVILGYDCLATGGELAEAILALAGVPPQHNSPDRDDYIKIVEDNIIPEKKHLFTKVKNENWLFHDIPYDFLSGSHYSFHKYTKNGMATIQLITPLNVFPGDGKGFSYTDIWKIRMLYNYISRKQANALKASDCIKLFEPGANFSSYQPTLEDKILPRNKPHKYLGLSDNEAFDNKEQAKDKSEENVQDSALNVQVTEKDEYNNDTQRDEFEKESDEENSSRAKLQIRSNEHLENQEISVPKTIVQLKKIISSSSDPFHDISDYESWETTKTLGRVFTRIKG